jgi:hypothetical protein
MPRLFGRDYPASDLRRLTGNLAQVAGIRLLERTDGKARGLRVADVWTGSGLRFQVLLDRALDIGPAEHAGRPLAWIHPALGTPAQLEPQGEGWLRTFGGGLVTTGGLTHFGQPETDEGQAFGLHGRIAHTPAESVRVAQEWRGEDYVLEIEGNVRETSALGENLLLRRRIATRLGASQILIEDRVRNEGFRPAPLMMLYHCNLGFPVVSPESELLLGPGEVMPRDEAARAGLEAWRRFEEPRPDFAGQVFFHAPHPGADGTVAAAVVNRPLGFGVYLRWHAAELPCLTQWKMMRPGDYVCALEPCTHPEAPRARLREEGRLRMLAPGEEVVHRLEIGVLDGRDAIHAFKRATDS